MGNNQCYFVEISILTNILAKPNWDWGTLSCLQYNEFKKCTFQHKNGRCTQRHLAAFFLRKKNYILFGKWSSSQWHLVEFADTNFVLQFVFLKAKSTFVARGSLSFWLVTCNFRKRRLYGYLSQIGIMFRQFDLVLRKNVVPWFFDMAEVKIPRKIEKNIILSKFIFFQFGFRV